MRRPPHRTKEAAFTACSTTVSPSAPALPLQPKGKGKGLKPCASAFPPGARSRRTVLSLCPVASLFCRPRAKGWLCDQEVELAGLLRYNEQISLLLPPPIILQCI